ncbi:hypothetical protein ES705_42688 [subsurface metagenome]
MEFKSIVIILIPVNSFFTIRPKLLVSSYTCTLRNFFNVLENVVDTPSNNPTCTVLNCGSSRSLSISYILKIPAVIDKMREYILLIIGCFVCFPPFLMVSDRSFSKILCNPIRSRNCANMNNPPREVIFFLSNQRGTLKNLLSVLVKRCIIFFTFQGTPFCLWF